MYIPNKFQKIISNKNDTNQNIILTIHSITPSQPLDPFYEPMAPEMLNSYQALVGTYEFDITIQNQSYICYRSKHGVYISAEQETLYIRIQTFGDNHLAITLCHEDISAFYLSHSLHGLANYEYQTGGMYDGGMIDGIAFVFSLSGF